MSDITESSERALGALRDEVESGSSGLRPSSPDQVCSICLGEITNKSVIDSCLHVFCFSCLSEWSKINPICPLCKRKFNVIFHSIKSMEDFQEYRLDHARIAHVKPVDPHIFMNLAARLGDSMALITSSPAPMAIAQPEIIVLSSDEGNAANIREDSDAEVIIIESVTEGINLEDSDVVEIKPPTPQLIEIADASYAQSFSPSLPSTSNNISGPSTSRPTDAPLPPKRTARFFRPSYREYSSSSEEDLPPKKKIAKRKVTGRSPNFKSSECVNSTSSDSEHSDGAIQKEEGTYQRYPRKKKLDHPSDSKRSHPRASHKGRRMSTRSSKQPAKVVDSSDSKSKKW